MKKGKFTIKSNEIKLRRNWIRSPIEKVHTGNRRLSRTQVKKQIRKEINDNL